MRSKLHWLLAIASLTVAGVAAAQMSPTPSSGPSSRPSGTPSTTESPSMPASPNAGGGAPTDPEFAKLDKDGDGKISKKEATSNKELAKRFNELDTDHDGSLEPAEFARFEAQPSSGGKSGGSTDYKP